MATPETSTEGLAGSVITAAQILETALLEPDASEAKSAISLVDVSTPLFCGFAPSGPTGEPVQVESFNTFRARFMTSTEATTDLTTLAQSVRGFFRNGGRRCWVFRWPGEPGQADLDQSVTAALLSAPCSIIAVPDIHRLSDDFTAVLDYQRQIIWRAQECGDRIVVLDPPPDLEPDEMIAWRRRLGVDSPTAAVYYPWLEVPLLGGGATETVPPSGHVIGSWSASDGTDGVQRAPTGQALEGVDGPVREISAADQRGLNRDGVNCLRAFPGPESRVWGACTLSDDEDWHFLHRRRVYQQLLASIAMGTSWLRTSPLDEVTCKRLRAEVSDLLEAAWQRGALLGTTEEQAFAVTCEPSTERPGHVSLSLGLALSQPDELHPVRMSLATAAVGAVDA